MHNVFQSSYFSSYAVFSYRIFFISLFAQLLSYINALHIAETNNINDLSICIISYYLCVEMIHLRRDNNVMGVLLKDFN